MKNIRVKLAPLAADDREQFILDNQYGDFEGERNGRYFTEDTFDKFIKVIQELTIEEEWITSDVRPGRGEEKWLNLILRKIQK